MNRRIPIIACLLAAMALSGCAAGRTGGRAGESLNQQVSRHEQQIQTILSQVGQVEQVLPGQAEMWSQMQTMRQELNTVHGQLDNITNGGGTGEAGTLRARVDRLEAAVRQMASQMGINVSSLDAPLPSAEPSAYGQQPTAPLTPPTPTGGTSSYEPVVVQPTTPVTTPPAASGTTTTAQAVYDSGIKAFDQRDYKQAIAIFKDFTATYPRHNLASNATFWEGECYYQLKDYGRAALAYQDVIDKYSGSNKIQAAMLKQGMALHMAGKKAAGKERLQELVRRYPNSMESTRAKKFMETNK